MLACKSFKLVHRTHTLYSLSNCFRIYCVLQPTATWKNPDIFKTEERCEDSPAGSPGWCHRWTLWGKTCSHVRSAFARSSTPRGPATRWSWCRTRPSWLPWPTWASCRSCCSRRSLRSILQNSSPRTLRRWCRLRIRYRWFPTREWRPPGPRWGSTWSPWCLWRSWPVQAATGSGRRAAAAACPRRPSCSCRGRSGRRCAGRPTYRWRCTLVGCTLVGCTLVGSHAGAEGHAWLTCSRRWAAQLEAGLRGPTHTVSKLYQFQQTFYYLNILTI